MKTWLTCLLCALSSVMPASVLAQVPAADGRPVHNIKLTDAREVADAKAVNSAITVLFKDAAACPAATSKEREACGCSFKGDLKKLKSAYDAAVANIRDGLKWT